mgnify:CR=1 FL=1
MGIIKIRTVINFAVIILVVGMFSSCESNGTFSSNEFGLEILKCFNEHDSETLKDMFCPYVQQTHDLDSEIAGAFKIIDNEIISYGNFIGGGETLYEEGNIIYKDITCRMPIKLSNDEKYSIYFFYMKTNKNEELVGIKRISIYNEELDTLLCTIGSEATK